MILVTGATGNVGKEVVKCLIKMLLSKSQRSRETEGVYFDFENPFICKGGFNRCY